MGGKRDLNFLFAQHYSCILPLYEGEGGKDQRQIVETSTLTSIYMDNLYQVSSLMSSSNTPDPNTFCIAINNNNNNKYSNATHNTATHNTATRNTATRNTTTHNTHNTATRNTTTRNTTIHNTTTLRIPSPRHMYIHTYLPMSEVTIHCLLLFMKAKMPSALAIPQPPSDTPPPMKTLVLAFSNLIITS